MYRRSELGQKLVAFINRDVTSNMLMLWGSRQSGKTVLIKQILEDYDGPFQYLNIDMYKDVHAIKEFGENLRELPKNLWQEGWLCAHWDRARELADSSGKPFVLVLDEIQKYPGWASHVKGQWDQDRWDDHSVLVILLGSSPRHLQKGGLPHSL